MQNNLKKFIVAVLVALPLTTGLGGCVTTSDMNSLRMELRQTRSQLNRKIDSIDKQSEAETATLRQEIEKSSTPLQTRQANLYAEIKALKMQVAKLQGTVDGMSESVNRLDAGNSNSTISLSDLSQKVDSMRMAIESQLAIDLNMITLGASETNKTTIGSTSSTVAAGGIAAIVTPEVKKPEPADPAQALYDKALESFKTRKYKDAIRDWSEFTKTFPKHKLVPNSIFWEGECYYQLKDYANAALKYQVVIAKHSKSNKYRSALLKQGLCLIKLGKTKSGKYILEDLIKKAPDSAEAKRAKTIIKNLKK
ncbi:tol-pal system protein YbgF [Maridesulfovibrio hydrothermalis]|uniref:Tol-pal system protein YbgF n=1 Tax=Maridesulfovibrio hydrothermalis AM13 = DSM 14728 TaxID=1121451 RepID=L0REA7_9BACT|nr:tol-pal system protein YbgF [Maridesulfovibrio hydrothermalis]CCO24515.1 Tol-pal system protein YbgF [Maridesulfovibrio hydrothermalis AM13 = DSM 14728]